MGKSLKFEFEGKEFTLEYTRKSIELMERRGFVASDIVDKPMTTLPQLFAGAFIAHHKNVNQDLVDRIFAKMSNKEALIGKLGEMYNEPLSTLMEEDEKNSITWEASF